MRRTAALLLLILSGAACGERDAPTSPPSESQAAHAGRAAHTIAELERELATKNREIERRQREAAEAKRAPSPEPKTPKAAGPAGAAPPMLRGEVQACDVKADVVILSIGAEDGLRAGDELRVSRGASYVSTIVIDSVFPQHAAGHTKPGMRTSDIAVGDVVETASAVGTEPEKKQR